MNIFIHMHEYVIITRAKEMEEELQEESSILLNVS